MFNYKYLKLIISLMLLSGVASCGSNTLLNSANFFTSYPPNTITVHNNLNVAVLKVPKIDNIFKVHNVKEKKFLEAIDILNNKDIQYEVYSGFNLNQFTKLYNDSKEKSLEESYEEYIIALKHNIIMNKVNKYASISESLTNEHKSLINKLLKTYPTEPKILYVICKNINDIGNNELVNNQRYLINYLNNLKSYIYNRKFTNVFIQEVQNVNVPIDQILLVVKVIPLEQFKLLPKQVNIYNAPKVNFKSWLEKVNNK